MPGGHPVMAALYLYENINMFVTQNSEVKTLQRPKDVYVSERSERKVVETRP
jgi:hypothetical protein